MKRILWILAIALAVLVPTAVCISTGNAATPEPSSPAPRASAAPPAAPQPLAVYTDKVVKSDDEWKKVLSSEQYRVLRQAGTELAWTGALVHNHAKGVYRCAACGQLL